MGKDRRLCSQTDLWLEFGSAAGWPWGSGDVFNPVVPQFPAFNLGVAVLTSEGCHQERTLRGASVRGGLDQHLSPSLFTIPGVT